MKKLFRYIKEKVTTNRSSILRTFLMLAVAVIILQLFNIQVLHHDDYVAQAEAQQTMQTTILARRGEIYMMDEGKPTAVVMNQKVWSVVLDPHAAMDSKDEIEKMLKANANDKIVGDFTQAFSNPDSRYYVIARNLDYETAKKIKNEGLPGVWLQETSARVYPEGEMASQLLGFVNADGVGQYGVESALDDRLNGENGVLKTVKDVNNIPLTVGDENVRIPAVDGENIVLSIDRNIQHAAEDSLKRTLEETGVAHGAVVVMDPQNGEILAMATLPNFDPANYAKVENAEVYQAYPVLSAFEPASICKTFTFAAAINEGKMTPNTTYVNEGVTYVDGWPIKNASQNNFGEITMQTALSWSLNTGSVQALRLLGGSQNEITYQGKQLLYDYYYNRFGIGQYTGIELVESPGIIYKPDSAEGTNARYANMTFGQGVTMTMTQIAAAYSSVINGGYYYTPTVVAGTINANGEFEKLPPKNSVRQTVANETSKTMREMLHNVRNLFRGVDTYDHDAFVGGKTGTAQAVKDNSYTFDETTGTFVGFGAKDEDSEPQYLIVTHVWNDDMALNGETHAKPVFDKLSDFMLNYLRMR